MATRAKTAIVVIALASTPAGLAQVLTYEADSVFPEDASPAWDRVGTFDATRWLSQSVLWIDVDLGAWAPPPGGEQDFYRRDIGEFQGTPFFVQWRCRSNAPNTEIEGSAGAFINSWGGGASYHFTITEDTIRFWRSNFLPILYFTIASDEFHTYRVETFGSGLYNVFLDGELFDSGTPQADFPNASAKILWGAKMWNTPSLNEWSYVRYGSIPMDASGDFDSDGDVDETDVYFFVDCLLGPAYDAAGPGCQWADMNSDGVANGKDIPLFVDAMLAA